MTRIAIVNRSIDGFGAATTTIIETTRGFAKIGWEVHLYAEHLDEERIRQAGGIGHPLPRWPWGSYFKRRLFDWLLERAIRGIKFDLICGNGDILSQDILILHNCVHAAHEAIYGNPLPENSGVGRIHKHILSGRRFRHMIANSEMMKREVVERFGVPAEMVTVVHPGYDPVQFRPEDREALGGPIRRELGLKREDILVGLITSGDFKKRGVSILLGAVGRLTSEIQAKLHVLIMGKETRLGLYRRLAQRAGLGTRGHFLPPASQVQRYYHALDLFAFPALYEEFGQSIQETLACGVPVLSSDRVGAAEFIRGPERELMTEKPEEEAFSRRLATLITQPELRKRMALAGIAACRHNTWEENFKRWRACYESLLLKTKSDPPPSSLPL